MKKLTLPEILSSTLLFGLSIFSLWRGAFWIIEQESVLHDSEFYQSLHNIMPIWIWGLMLVFSSLFMLCASWLLPKRNNLFNWLLLLGGGTVATMYLLMTGASLFNAINWLTPMQFATLSAIFAVVAFFGGAEIYGRRR